MKNPSLQAALENVVKPEANYAELIKAFARKFIATQRGEFTVEDIADAYKAMAYPLPKEPRVWGIMQGLSNEGLIHSVGSTKSRSKTRNSGYVTVWRKTVHFEQYEAKELIGRQAKLF